MTTETSHPAQPALPPRPPLARGRVLSAVGALVVVLTATSGGYGYHRDELYFRMLRPAWGYVDQPPLAPALARLMSGVVDAPWALRIPSTLAAALAVVVMALLTRELGGGARAQALCAWGFAFASFPLVFGHLLLTTAIDVLAWLALVLCLVRALLRRQPRWWLAAGLVAGLATYDKLLVGLLVVSLVVGLVVAGPWRLPWRWVGAAAVVAAVVASPNLVYQATHDWPQVTMGRALGASNGSEVRAQLGPFLFLLLGPPLTLVWAVGWWQLLRRPAWRALRCLPVATVVLLALTAVGGGQIYYPLGLVSVLYAAGCVPAATLATRAVGWWRALVALVGVNVVVSSLIALPLVPLGALGASPVPGINQAVGDQVGWGAYVREVGDVYAALPASERGGAIVITSNYGEAGAIARYGPGHALPQPFSGHNALADQAVPPATRVTAVVVGSGAAARAARFSTCTVVAHLDNGVDVDNEEQDEPVAVCRDPRETWAAAWPTFRHLD